MTKLNSLLLTISSLVFLAGCGGGSSSSNSSTTTSVPVTKGPLILSTTVDQSGKRGTQIPKTNKYEFTGEITYPITVTGGYVDVNNNGDVEKGIDYEFVGELSSYSKVVTPITTYLGDTSTVDGKAKLDALKELIGASDDELLAKDPSETNEDVIALVGAIYQTYPTLMDNNEDNDEIMDDIDDENSALSTKFKDYKDVLSSGEFEGETLEDKLVRVEEHLRDNSDVTTITQLDLDKINFSKEDLVGNKLSVENETYYFRDNDIVLGDSGDDYTQTLTYGTIENGSVKVMFENGEYDLIALSETGFDISYYENDVLDEKVSITSELTEYTTSELDIVLLDIPFEFTENMISGKEIIIDDNEGFYEGQFKADGTYYEEWDDTKSDGDSGTCNGTWALNTESAGRIDIKSTCSDNNGEESYYLEFSEKPVNGSSFKVVEADETFTVTITKIDAIDNNEENDNSTFTLTNDMVSGKTIYFDDNDGFSSLIFEENGAYYEYTDDSNSNGDIVRCWGDWELDTTKENSLKIDYMCSEPFVPNEVSEAHYSTMYITINEELKTGSTVSYVDGDDSGESNINAIGNVIVSNKIFKLSDSEGPVTAEFSPDGSYTETGTDDEGEYSCSGFWADLGNNKIAMTCEDIGTAKLPNGNIGGTSDEIHFQFNSSNPQKDETVTVTYDEDGDEGVDTLTIDSILPY